MSYKELLQSKEWKQKREEILSRDAFSCQQSNCDKTLNPFVKLISIWDLETYSKEKGFYSFEIDYNSNNLIFNGVNKQEIKFDFKIKENIDFKDLLIVKYESQIGKILLPSYWVVNGIGGVTILNVHHKLYVKGRNPWEYMDEDLITLCIDCHRKVHETEIIPIYNENGVYLNNAQICEKCGGSGYLPEYHYFQSGVCFRCDGEGVIL